MRGVVTWYDRITALMSITALMRADKKITWRSLATADGWIPACTVPMKLNQTVLPLLTVATGTLVAWRRASAETISAEEIVVTCDIHPPKVHLLTEASVDVIEQPMDVSGARQRAHGRQGEASKQGTDRLAGTKKRDRQSFRDV
jgi:hypothetical protein